MVSEPNEMVSEPNEQENRRLHYELEHAIKIINSEQIGVATGPISREAFFNVAKLVACLRARYLHTLLKLGSECGNECIETEVALELKRLREAYIEAQEGFAALEHALNRGYVQLKS
ncbi:MAG: hypothetical protein H6977_07615 [Gammaproteobacteria bacterium]|nr:hypothetical protein [Gammaproteobacteria bacterium]MCP5199863.1 hypothetical protein [Gammaproteobacteria bacterium]